MGRSLAAESAGLAVAEAILVLRSQWLQVIHTLRAASAHEQTATVDDLKRASTYIDEALVASPM